MKTIRVGLVWHGDRESRDSANIAGSRFEKAAQAMKDAGFKPVPVIYNDDFIDEIRRQMMGLDALQVWVNPLESGRDRTHLDALLREVAASGVLVNTHPDTILKMGTKQVLVQTRVMGWGSDVCAVTSLDQLENELPGRLDKGPRVLKQLRGHSGGGIWKVERADGGKIKLRHAQRGCVEEVVSFTELVERMRSYFESNGSMIDQAYQSRLDEGITRVYMVEAQVGGFGHQAINALFPAPVGEDPKNAPQPGPRLYFPPDEPQFQAIGRLMESVWIAQLQACLGLSTADLPLLWDADFMLGPKDADGNDTYVLCEINVSCVSPYPEWANPLIASTLARRIQEAHS